MYFKCYLLLVSLTFFPSLVATHGDEIERSASTQQKSPPIDMLSELEAEKTHKPPEKKLEKHIFKAAYYSAQKGLMLRKINPNNFDAADIKFVNQLHNLMNVHVIQSQIYAIELGRSNQWLCMRLNKAREKYWRDLVEEIRLKKIKSCIKKAAGYSVRKAVLLHGMRVSQLQGFTMRRINSCHTSMNNALQKAEVYGAKAGKDLSWIIERFNRVRKELLETHQDVAKIFCK